MQPLGNHGTFKNVKGKGAVSIYSSPITSSYLSVTINIWYVHNFPSFIMCKYPPTSIPNYMLSSKLQPNYLTTMVQSKATRWLHQSSSLRQHHPLHQRPSKAIFHSMTGLEVQVGVTSTSYSKVASKPKPRYWSSIGAGERKYPARTHAFVYHMDNRYGYSWRWQVPLGISSHDQHGILYPQHAYC